MSAPLIIKTCGLSTVETVDVALGAGADMIGLVFFPKSPRHVSFELASKLAARIKGRAELVALTVDADDALLGQIIAAIDPDWLQLHGQETPERVKEIREKFGRRVMKAIGVREAADIAKASAYEPVCDRILFDSKPPKSADVPGGTGKSFDWHLLENLDLTKPFMLSGGLDAENVAEALEITHAPALDVSSGIEAERGIKDPALIAAFISAARGSAPN